MLYVDVPWLAALQHDLGLSRNVDFHAFSTGLTTRPDLYAGLNRLYAALTDALNDSLQKDSAAITFFSDVQSALALMPISTDNANHRLVRAVEYIRDNYTRSLKLDEICEAAGLSASYLIRAFKQRYGMTPHAYLTNCRIEYSRTQLRRARRSSMSRSKLALRSGSFAAGLPAVRRGHAGAVPWRGVKRARVIA